MSDQKPTVWALADIRRTGKGLPVVLEGRPLDGDEAEIPLLGDGVLVSHRMPDTCGS
jgi:hypothetical protein